MNPTAFQPRPRQTVTPLFPRPRRRRSRERMYPASHSFLEPRGEGILFAVLCVLCSSIIYAGVLLVRFLG